MTYVNTEESIEHKEQGLGGQVDYLKRKPKASLTPSPQPTLKFGTMAVKATFLPSIHFGGPAKTYF